MKLRQVLMSGWVVLALMLICSSVAGAEVVGRLTQVEGRVDLLKGGNLPAIPLKVDDTVEPGDVIRTKSLSKAQITFIDNSLLTLSQEARIAIEEFKFEPGQGKRRAVLEIFQGLALAVVNKILKAEEPDFIIKTQTAIVGVRGTEFGMRNQPNSSTILNFPGRTQVGNIFPEVSRLFLKAFKVAFSMGSWNDGSSRWVLLRRYAGNHGSPEPAPDRALWYHPPGPGCCSCASSPPMLPVRANTTPRDPGGQPGRVPASKPPSPLNLPGAQNTANNLTTITVPPKVVPRSRPPRPPRADPRAGPISRA